jgi:membrane-associated protein
MNFFRFWLFNVVGGVAWMLACVFAGVFFGKFEFVKKHFELVLIAIVVISVIPMAIEFLRVWGKVGARGFQHEMKSSGESP